MESQFGDSCRKGVTCPKTGLFGILGFPRFCCAPSYFCQIIIFHYLQLAVGKLVWRLPWKSCDRQLWNTAVWFCKVGLRTLFLLFVFFSLPTIPKNTHLGRESKPSPVLAQPRHSELQSAGKGSRGHRGRYAHEGGRGSHSFPQEHRLAGSALALALAFQDATATSRAVC